MQTQEVTDWFTAIALLLLVLAATGSLVWFLLLGVAAFWLGRRLNSLRIWRLLDGAVALMMWGTGGWLIASLF